MKKIYLKREEDMTKALYVSIKHIISQLKGPPLVWKR